MTTIFDVARRASVSITTVSHVFSGKGTIAAATRARVLDAARELNYAPSKVGTALATGRTFTIALLLPNPLDLCLVNPAFGEMVLTVTEECSAADYSVQGPQPRGLTVKARNCSAAFRAAPRPDRQEPGQS